jgi:alpha-1,2-rhamnosyltransferase
LSEEKNRLFIECSATYYRGLNTGIQRVVRNIVQLGPSFAEDHGLEIVPVVVEYGHFWRMKEAAQIGAASKRKTSFIRLGTRLSVWLQQMEDRIVELAKSWRALKIIVLFISAARKQIRVGGTHLLRLKFLREILTGKFRRI